MKTLLFQNKISKTMTQRSYLLSKQHLFYYLNHPTTFASLFFSFKKVWWTFKSGFWYEFADSHLFDVKMVENNDENDVTVTIGVCAMARKVMSKPMKEILRRMDKFQHIEVIIFDERMILNDPIEKWPICEALVSFYSEGFPLEKAIAYSKLRKPYLVNDLESQYILMDRRRVYECLKREGVPVPRYAYVDRSNGLSTKVVEYDDSIEVSTSVRVYMDRYSSSFTYISSCVNLYVE